MTGQATSVLSDWRKGSVLDTVVTDYKKPEQGIKRLCLITQSRPTKPELQRNLDHLKESKKKEEAWREYSSSCR